MNLQRMWVLFAAAICAAAWSAAAQVGTELIANGDFSKLDERGCAVGWPQTRNARIAKDATGNRLAIEGAGVSVNLKIPLKPEYGRLRLSMKMKVTDVALGKESWNTGRLAMSFHNEAGDRVGEWPDVFGMIGTVDWQTCERIYPVPEGAVSLSFSPGNLGASGTVGFRDISLTVARIRAMAKADAPPPPGLRGNPWSLDDAWRQATPTREKICLNGMWGFRPVLQSETADRVPATGDCWGWFRIPGIWPNSAPEFAAGPQTLWIAPCWKSAGGSACPTRRGTSGGSRFRPHGRAAASRWTSRCCSRMRGRSWTALPAASCGIPAANWI